MIPKFTFWSARSHAPLAIILTVALTVGSVFVIRWMSPSLAKFSTTDLIAIVAVVATGTQISVEILLHSLDSRSAKKTRIDLEVDVHGPQVRVSCSFECLGHRRVVPKNIYLFVEKGILNTSGVYEFPYLLKHEQGEYDCVLSKRCKHGGITEFPNELVPAHFRNDFQPLAMTLKHLSSESILFMDPGEYFREDKMLELSLSGVYRATLVFTATNADCICTTRQFIVPGIIKAEAEKRSRPRREG